MTTKKFTPTQQAQLQLAKKANIDTVCKNHPEWGPMLINFCIDREKNGWPLDPIFKTAAYLEKYIPKTNGILNDDFELIHYVLQAYAANMDPDPPPIRADGALDTYMLLYLATKASLLQKQTPVLPSGRVFAGNAGAVDLPHLLSEGSKHVHNLLRSIQTWAALNRSMDGKYQEIQSANRIMAGKTALLTLDRLNIRGYQVPYALEYTGGSIEMLTRLIQCAEHNIQQAEPMCEYINKKSGTDFLSGQKDHNQIAGVDGSKFVITNNTLASQLARLDTQPLTINWNSLDIAASMDIEQALRIMNARGFQLIRQVESPDRIDPNIKHACLTLYNPETCDYIQAPVCERDDICYGGISLYMHRTTDGPYNSRMLDWLCNSGPHDGQLGHYYEFTQHNGLFRKFEQSKQMLPDEKRPFDWYKIGFACNGIPVPVYFHMPLLTQMQKQERLSPKLINLLGNLGEYHFEQLVNHILCYYDFDLMESASPHYKAHYRDWFCDKGLYESVMWLAGDELCASIICSAVFTYLQMPASTIEKFLQGQPPHLKDMKREKFQQLKTSITNNSDYGREIIKAYQLPNPKTLPIRLPWL